LNRRCPDVVALFVAGDAVEESLESFVERTDSEAEQDFSPGCDDE